ncbi:amino acid ABC transporter permease [Pseudochrobactrum algeriensis]|uniref:General L-amino acid transport system permease protein n=1 Tax=Pseudochrobactrum saccharolyticum TaxID=354352 RepID=A0A7W8AP49_9HYPH|nr:MULTISPECIES: amino acid ABC transporter permease [Pseudochrobactrum]MBX8813393.1 amino acid ABC transporter permease [Ochrobactrum sp. MR34]KAB0539908.1 amino acid ABC transporter permease [Pseudochrobactrum saccharolyticum]MBB5092738.1 general L-amino acid transport system permease protein [Pseudochrobactrum saccharolyticum]QVQ37802.1 amino acid ABC transporter permease [Pseudochrobactrum algeriensis]QVQ41023.1 amino acid ABC transporter permease [Pseudochrobactrum algeriensis]
MTNSDLQYVRSQMVDPMPAPASQKGIASWMKENLFSSLKDTVLTIMGISLIVWFLPGLINWLFVNAVWAGTDRTFCTTTVQGGLQPDGWSGACWAFVDAKLQQFLYGRYPVDERWRVKLVALVFVILLVPMLIGKLPHKMLNAVLLFIVFPVFTYFLLVGGSFGLRYVETSLWGGLLVTLILSVVGITVSLPMGILLALGRRSNMPVIKTLCVIFIEVIRGVPLVALLFMASVMLPLFMPPGTSFDKFLRALVGVSLFASAYMAEVIRGGLQAIPSGQYEGADSLGLSYWQKTLFIILPQTLKLALPGIVNTFIGLFKDTSLVYIIGMFDLLGIVRQNFSDATWATPQTPATGLVFAGFVFWIFCFCMSRYSLYMERRLDTSHR